MRQRTVLVTIVVAVVAVIAGALLFRHREAASPAETPATTAFYQQKLADSQGTVRDLAGYRGQVVVVNFWATWCAPCVKEIPAFSKANERAQGRVAFVGLGIDSAANIAAFNDRMRPSYPLLVAGAGGTDLVRALGNPAGGLPFTLLLGTDGRILQSRLGTVDDDEMSRWLAPYLKDRAS